MSRHDLALRDPLAWLAPHLKGHALLFDPARPGAYDASSGIRLLATFLLLEVVIGPRLWLWNLVGLAAPPTWVRVPLLLVAALVLVRYFAGVRLPDVGLRPWREWTT